MRVLLNHDRDPDCALICFGQVVGCDPFMLLGRTPNAQFRFADLEGLRVGIVSEVPTPWMTLQDDLRRAGIDPGGLMRGPKRSMAENVAALAAGELDVIQVMEPYAANAMADAMAHLWHRFSLRGNLAFTTFYAPRAFLETRPEACAALTKAMHHAVSRLYAMPAAEVADIISPWFATTKIERLTAAIAGYQAARIWTENPSIAVDHLCKLKAALLSGGLISRDIPYESVVDDRFAAGVAL